MSLSNKWNKDKLIRANKIIKMNSYFNINKN